MSSASRRRSLRTLRRYVNIARSRSTRSCPAYGSVRKAKVIWLLHLFSRKRCRSPETHWSTFGNAFVRLAARQARGYPLLDDVAYLGWFGQSAVSRLHPCLIVRTAL